MGKRTLASPAAPGVADTVPDASWRRSERPTHDRGTTTVAGARASAPRKLGEEGLEPDGSGPSVGHELGGQGHGANIRRGCDSTTRHGDRCWTGAITDAQQGLSLDTGAGRTVLVATVLGSALVSLDATVVNVALPTIGAHLHAQLAGLQWVLTGYLLTLASLILVGGALGDRYGRRRVFRIGVVLFVTTSAACAAAPDLPVLVAARVLQGAAGALLLPGSLAILQASFAPGQRGRAIGAWSAFGGVANAFGPFLGGWLVEAVSWRLVFLLNVPLGIAVMAISGAIPETRDDTATGPVDLVGAATLTLGLGGVTFALIQAGGHGGGGVVALPALVGIGALLLFALTGRSRPNALIPPGLFAAPMFRATNAVTLVLYTALGSLFLITIELQNALGYSPVEAGAALLPLTVIMLALSARSGALAERIGPRLPMTVGSFLASAGLMMFSRIGPGSTYVADVLPAATVFGFGIAGFVAPLTAAVLSVGADRARQHRLGGEQRHRPRGRPDGGGGPPRARGPQRRRLPPAAGAHRRLPVGHGDRRGAGGGRRGHQLGVRAADARGPRRRAPGVLPHRRHAVALTPHCAWPVSASTRRPCGAPRPPGRPRP